MAIESITPARPKFREPQEPYVRARQLAELQRQRKQACNSVRRLCRRGFPVADTDAATALFRELRRLSSAFLSATMLIRELELH
jgi:hypothetical protein